MVEELVIVNYLIYLFNNNLKNSCERDYEIVRLWIYAGI